MDDFEGQYLWVLEQVKSGERRAAFGALTSLLPKCPPAFAPTIRNDLGVLAALEGHTDDAEGWLKDALQIQPDNPVFLRNLKSLAARSTAPSNREPVRVAILSLLFNWPSTGGGTVHTAELAYFLARDGFEVRHVYARFDPWRVGQVTEPTPHPTEELAFYGEEWNRSTIQERFRQQVDRFDPDFVIISDSWNFKPWLACAVEGRRVILRLQALECLCPLNNVRLVPSHQGPPEQCPRHQLATFDTCRACVRRNDASSGSLHQLERSLAETDTLAYRDALYRAFSHSEAVFVVNPPTEAMVSPYAKSTRVVTAGMDPDRFPPNPYVVPTDGRPLRILFAGLTGEWIKGYQVVAEACARLRRIRKDFELIVTDDADPSIERSGWIQMLGWQTQAKLPLVYAASDAVVVPPIAQEALGRTAVEGMAAGRAVVASRIGGLPYVVADGQTGFLFEPGNVRDLAQKLAQLLDDPSLRIKMGAAGRERFENLFAWPSIIARHYRPVLSNPIRPPYQE
jgi:glycosyltransferase involved in cell wall biosynthesis